MSGLAIGRGKVIGLTAATAAVVSLMAGSGMAQAAQSPGVSPRVPAGSGLKAATTSRPQIASSCTIKGYSPKKIVLGATAATQTVSVKVTGCTIDAWDVVYRPFYDGLPLSTKGVAGNYSYWDKNAEGDDVKVQLRPKISLSPKQLSNSYAGKYDEGTVVEIWGVGESESEPAWKYLPLTLQRRATFGSTFNASPEPVKKGKKISIKATLARINWTGSKTLKYVGFSGQAKVQFKADGDSAYKTVKTVTASSKGKVSTTVKASKSGRWRLVFAGYTTTSSATSASDAVRVN
jgi:hypothetical protein